MNKLVINESSKFKRLDDFLNWLKKDKTVVKWEFFHPFFYLMTNKHEICQIGDGLLNKNKNNFFSTLKLKLRNEDKTLNLEIHNLDGAEILSIFYCYIDEMCGNFVYTIDPDFFLTTSIELDSIDNKQIVTISEDNKEKDIDFLCLVEVDTITKSGIKINLNFSLYKVEKEDPLQFSFILSGKSKFQKPKVLLPMSISSKF